jgi:predicted Rossmann fold flavoprotein
LQEGEPVNHVLVMGGGAAGFFGAIACAEAAPGAEVTILEKGPEFLQKVRISGGGRCNVTHACFDARELTRRYPRGERELIGPYHVFQARDTVAWFERRGVKLKTEPDGRMFPVTDSSSTIVDCLMGSARAAGVNLRANTGVTSIRRIESGVFEASLSGGATLHADAVLLATGGCRTPALGALAAGLGHTLEPPVPSLFTFQIEAPWVRGLAGISVPSAEAAVPGARLRERGPVLFTHWGLSGPAILRLSAWGARELAARDYRFELQLNWAPGLNEEQLRAELETRARQHGAKAVANTPLFGLPARLWEQLAGPEGQRRWSELSKAGRQELLQRISRTVLPVTGKSLNKDEFVTCGGVRLSEVNFKTMESKLCPGLFFAGEVLDIDGITGGFNFQAAWTTGWIAGTSIARRLGGE